MLKGLGLFPPVVGRIAIGKVVERNDKRLPQKDDEFTLTSQVHSSGQWIRHPIDDSLRGAPGADNKPVKLRSLPVRLLFDDPELNLRSAYTLFDRNSGRPTCAGNGASCKRVNNGIIEQHDCPSPSACPLGIREACKPYGRLYVQIGEEHDGGGCFILRTTGFNTIRTLATRMQYFAAASGNLLSALPLQLRLRAKSTTMSRGTPIYYVDLGLRDGMDWVETLQQAKAYRQMLQDAGFDQAALDHAAKTGFEQAALAEVDEAAEDSVGVLEEFYPEPESEMPKDISLEHKLAHRRTKMHERVLQAEAQAEVTCAQVDD